MLVATYLLRALALLFPYAAAFLLWFQRRGERTVGKLPETTPPPQRGNRLPLIVNVIALGLLFLTIGEAFTLPGLPDSGFLLCALAGFVFVVLGTIIMLQARRALGASWSFAPRASQATGLVTSGLYARVRHPVYLGFALGLLGVAVAFANWAAVLVVLLVIIPSLLWRAREEERLLTAVYGEEYRLYRRRTKMVIPYLI
jgi:protein-S-isoprenylcysteine O-methyltransferase Ste14